MECVKINSLFFAHSLYIKYTGGCRGQRPLAKMTKYIINQTSTILIKKTTTLAAVIDHDQISKSVDRKSTTSHHTTSQHSFVYSFGQFLGSRSLSLIEFHSIDNYNRLRSDFDEIGNYDRK